MQAAAAKRELVGFIELQVGSIAVQLPIRNAVGPPPEGQPLATFEAQGNDCSIIVHGDNSMSKQVETAVAQAAQVALKHLSRKLLN